MGINDLIWLTIKTQYTLHGQQHHITLWVLGVHIMYVVAPDLLLITGATQLEVLPKY